MRLIDADAIDYDEYWYRNGEGFTIDVCQKAQRIIDEQPTIESSGDLISRADAVNAVHKYFVNLFNDEPYETDEDGDEVFTDMKSVNALLKHNKAVSKALKALPSADRPKGEWKDAYRKTANFVEFSVLACSECNYADPQMNYYNYCPNCGAEMGEPK